MKKVLTIIFISILYLDTSAQQFSLSHSGTQYDSFENPVEKSFEKNQSRKYAMNLLPALYAFGSFEGDAQTAFKKYLFTRQFGASNFGAFTNNNTTNYDAGFYLFMFSIFKTTNYNRELSFSLKFKNEGNLNISNGTFALLDDFRKFNNGTTYNNVLNSNGINQSYWQLAANYRENYNDTWGFGAKVALIDGATYSKIDINSSDLLINNTTYTANLQGRYRSSFGTDSFTYQKLLPDLKNLGASISLGASYTTNKDIYLSLNLKDLGFIHWNKKNALYDFNSTIKVDSADKRGANSRFFSEFEKTINVDKREDNFNSTIDSRATFIASKEIDFYKGTFVLNKSFFNKSGQVALVNTFRKNAFNLSINPVYDFISKLNLGSQLMIKSDNAEFYVGSEQVFPTYYFSKGYLTKSENIGKNSPRASVYIGLNIKFGRKMQDIGNADFIPGLNDKETGFVSRLSKKELKRVQKKNREIEKRRRKNNKRNRKR